MEAFERNVLDYNEGGASDVVFELYLGPDLTGVVMS